MQNFPSVAHTFGMKISAILSIAALILCGLNFCINALFGVDVLLVLCAYNALVYRTVNSFFGVAALFIAFWTIAFKPFHNLC